MNRKHTPGPWKRGYTHPENISACSALVCVVSKRSKFTSEQEANALLISAAPELLEALENLMREYSATCPFGRDERAMKMLDGCCAAIAKAKGAA